MKHIFSREKLIHLLPNKSFCKHIFRTLSKLSEDHLDNCCFMAIRGLTRLKLLHVLPNIKQSILNLCEPTLLLRPQNDGLGVRHLHDGRPRGPLWKGKKLIGKEALFAILGLKRFKDNEEMLNKFAKSHVLRLLKMDMVAVLIELERQEEVVLAVKVFKIIQKEDWYVPDVYLYKDLIIALSRCKRMEEAMQVWESMRKDNLFPDSQTYAEVIRGFLKYGSPADAMNIYEDMKNSPDPPEELPFRILLKGLLPHPLLRNRVKQDFEEMFPDRHVYDPPEEIFNVH